MNDHLNASNSPKVGQGKEPIAIVGIGCRFPGKVNSPGEFWHFLQNGGDAIIDVPSDRWPLSEYYDPDTTKAGKIKNSKGGFLDKVDQFDADFFGIFPTEANRIDPQQRMLLEVTYEALEDAGIKLDEFSGSKTAVYIGVFMNDYWDIQASSLQRDQMSPHVAMGVTRTSAANRISYLYNLKGPSVTIDTACSSSLVGVHLACQSIWSGESTHGLAGGVNLMLRPESSIMMSKGNFLSPDGYCKSFDSRANGYVRSEGCGVVLLKPLSQAQADGDHIYATILGSAVNQDGYTEEGFTVPSFTSQAEMLKTAYEEAGIDPTTVAYVEAHGTGTPVGDPIETQAFGEIIGKGRDDNQKCWIGSVKSNIGHLEAAAGVAGLIKLALVLKNKQIPQNLHFENPNPKIPFDQYKLRVPVQLEELPRNGSPVIGGVNSFGAGGTNAHLVLQEYDTSSSIQDGIAREDEEEVSLFTLSAKSMEALKANAGRYIAYLDNTKDRLQDICYSSAIRRTSYEYRIAIATRSKKALKDHLQAFLKEETRPGMTFQKRNRQENPKVGFIFSGQGPQWYAMGQQLIQSSPVFRETIFKIEKTFVKLAHWSLLEEMSKDEASSRVSETKIAQPAIMAIQIALAELWKSWGVRPDGCVGHSIGEVAAAYTAGALTLEQAVEVIYHRSRGQDKATDKGKMLAVAVTLEEAREIIRGKEARVSIAAINGPNMLTLSGDKEPLEAIAAQLDKQDIFHRFLRVNVPFHSHHMEPLKEELIASLEHLVPAKAETSLYSTVTGKQESGEHLVSSYWYSNVREPVYFTDALQQMINEGFNTFIEIAPHPILTAGAQELLNQNDIKNTLIVPSLRREEDEAITITGALGMLYSYGYEVAWKKFFGTQHHYVKLPAYVWQHARYWFESRDNAEKRLGIKVHPHLSGFKQSVISNSFIWDMHLDPAVHTYINDHKVDGTIVFPGTGHLETAYAAAKASFPNDFDFLEDIHFESALFIPEEGESPEARLEISSEEGTYFLCTRPQGEQAAWTKHSRGTMNTLKDQFKSASRDLAEIRERVDLPVSVSDYYLELKESGLQYGETFRCIKKLWVNEKSKELLAHLSLSKKCVYGADRFHFHPTLLDACLHSIEYVGKWTNAEEKSGIYLPTYIQRFKIHQKPGKKVWCYIQVDEAKEEYLTGNYWIFNEDGTLVCEIQGLECKYIEGSRGEEKDELYKGMYQFKWEKLEEVETLVSSGRGNGEADGGFLVFADNHGLADKLLKHFQKDDLSPIIISKGESFREVADLQYIVDPNEQSDIEHAIRALLNKGHQINRILYLWSLDAHFEAEITTIALKAQQEQLAQATLNTFRAIVSQGVEPLIHVVTQGVESVLEKDPVNLSQASAFGISRVMMNEYPFITTSIIDLSQTPSDEELALLYDYFTIPEKPHFPEVALRGNDQYIRKLEEVIEELAEEAASKSLPALGSYYSAEVREHGAGEKIVLRHSQAQTPKEGELKIEVRASGLTFRDLRTVQKQPAQLEANFLLGWECTGVITAVGKGITDFQIGDEVIAWTSNCLGGYAIASEKHAVLKPLGLSFEEAAGVPVAYLTAYYALSKVAQVAEGDWVFIHQATDPVGLAALQLAQLMKARIVASTVKKNEYTYERTYLRALGVEHVLDTSSPTFMKEVQDITQGRGVDVFLYSYTGLSTGQSLKCMAPFGKFIDLSKGSDPKEKKLVLNHMESNVSYHAVDLERLMTQKPSLGKNMLNEIALLFDKKKVNGLPTKVYPIHDLNGAFQKMLMGEYLGKTVISMDKSPIRILPAATLRLQEDASYLVTGGASGFGLSLAEWLSEKGARHLVLMSRSGCKHDSDFQAVDRMKKKGVQVYLANVDITDGEKIQQEIGKIREEMPPLKGIIHSAAVLDDATLLNTDLQRFMRVFQPKVLGAWNLHLATQKDSLDFFLMLSSISSMFGLPGQSAYSSANNFLDRLAHYRQSVGLAASSVNLGVLGQYAGMSRDGGNVMNVLENQGWLPLSLRQVTDKIENILLQQPAQRMAANLDWKRFKDFFTHLDKDVRFARFINQSNTEGTNGSAMLKDEILNASKEQQQAILKNKLAEALAKILGTSSEKIDTGISIAQMGLDSLMLNQLRNWIQQKLDINFPLMKIAKGPSINELAKMLVEDPNEPDQQKEEIMAKDSSGIGLGDEMEVVNEWLVRNKANVQEIERRIFCIHPVGAGASMFSHFLYHPPTNTDVMAFQLPGRENRSEEKPYEDMLQLIPDMANAIRPYLDKPFVVIGHSFGGIIGFELIRFLRNQHGIQPLQLFICGTIAPQLTQSWKKSEAISKTAIRSYSEEKIIGILNYIDDVDFLRTILPVMRNDMPLIMSYPYKEEEKLDFPITAFAADKDEVVQIEEIGAWKEQTSGNFTLEVVEGDHWFLSRNKELILQRLTEAVQQNIPPVLTN